MRAALLGIGLFCCLIGIEMLIVDQIVLHDFSMEQAESQPAESRLVDLPDWAGFALVAGGLALVMAHLALGRPPEPKRQQPPPR